MIPIHKAFSQDEKSILVDSILNYRQDFLSVSPSLEAARDETLRLESELKGNALVGCHASEALKTLRVEIDGSETPFESLGEEKALRKDAGSCPPGLEVRLGSNIAFNVTPGTKLLGSSYVKNDFSETILLGAIEYVRIRKTGTCFEGYEKSKGSTIARLFVEKTAYDNMEKNIYHVYGVRIFANDQKIYERSGLNILFNRNNTGAWTDAALRSNSAWIKFMVSQNCNQTA